MDDVSGPPQNGGSTHPICWFHKDEQNFSGATGTIPQPSGYFRNFYTKAQTLDQNSELFVNVLPESDRPKSTLNNLNGRATFSHGDLHRTLSIVSIFSRYILSRTIYVTFNQSMTVVYSCDVWFYLYLPINDNGVNIFPAETTVA